MSNMVYEVFKERLLTNNWRYVYDYAFSQVMDNREMGIKCRARVFKMEVPGGAIWTWELFTPGDSNDQPISQ